MKKDVVQHYANEIEQVLYGSSCYVRHCKDQESAGVRVTAQATAPTQIMLIEKAMMPAGTRLGISQAFVQICYDILLELSWIRVNS